MTGQYIGKGDSAANWVRIVEIDRIAYGSNVFEDVVSTLLWWEKRGKWGNTEKVEGACELVGSVVKTVDVVKKSGRVVVKIVDKSSRVIRSERLELEMRWIITRNWR